MGAKALLVIDMLNDFLEPQGVLYCGDKVREIIPEVKSLVESFLKEDSEVIFICDSHREDDEEFKLFKPHCIKGTWGSQVIKELSPFLEKAKKVEKTRFSGFFKTELEEILRASGIEELWLTGVCTSICVMDTCKDAYERGFKIVIPVKAVGDFNPEFHEFALKRMEAVYGAKLK